VKVVGRISGTSFDAIETAAADLRLEGDAVVLPDPASRAPGHLRIEASVPGI
jgi:1,6-anhydro-N-acetylmuramate kinase